MNEYLGVWGVIKCRSDKTFSAIKKGAQFPYKIISGDVTNKEVESTIVGIGNAVGQLAGLPTRNVKNQIQGVFDKYFKENTKGVDIGFDYSVF